MFLSAVLFNRKCNLFFLILFQVFIGSLIFPLGTVEFVQQNPLTSVVFNIITAICVIGAVAVGVYFVYRCCFKKKKKYPDYRVTFTWNPNNETCNGGVTRQPSSCNGKSQFLGRFHKKH